MILGFRPQFVESILLGIKIHTLRKDQKDRWQPGIRIHMATGTRTKDYKCFNNTEYCISTQKVKLVVEPEYIHIEVDGKELTPSRLFRFFMNDGFFHMYAFRNFFGTGTHKLKLIHWTDLKY